MRKAVRLGDLLFVKAGDGYALSHLYPNSPAGKRFRITDTLLTSEEVAGMGVDPETGTGKKADLSLHLACGDDYWCIILIDANTREPVRSLGKIPDEVVSNIFHYRTPEVTQFKDLSYEDMRKVRKNRDDNAFRARTLAHMDDTRIIRDTLTGILNEMKKRDSERQTASKPARKRKPTPKPADN